MDKGLLIGIWRYILRIPRRIWQGQVVRGAESGQRWLSFMTDDHHRIRDFVVLELPRYEKPIPPEHIAQNLDLPMDQVKDTLDELERKLTFLFRNEQGAVTWAYPVTVDTTPHRVTFSTGEQLYAA